MHSPLRSGAEKVGALDGSRDPCLLAIPRLGPAAPDRRVQSENQLPQPYTRSQHGCYAGDEIVDHFRGSHAIVSLA